jgi:hypothetical protein
VVQLDGSNKLFSNAPATDRNVLADIHINRNYDKASGEGGRSLKSEELLGLAIAFNSHSAIALQTPPSEQNQRSHY